MRQMTIMFNLAAVTRDIEVERTPARGRVVPLPAYDSGTSPGPVDVLFQNGPSNLGTGSDLVSFPCMWSSATPRSLLRPYSYVRPACTHLSPFEVAAKR
jgi:hypothetical protein